MNKKSKFLTCLLSFIPGLSHLYLGFGTRGFIFFTLFFGAIFGVFGMSILTGSNDIILLLAFILPVIWFISLVDAVSLSDRGKTESVSCEDEQGKADVGSMYPGTSNRTLIAAALSLVPGAGHMYLGFQKLGVELMSVFFLAIFFMSWLNISFFLFVLPIIWFYSLFDALHRAEENYVSQEEVSLPLSWISLNPRLIGWGLILLGCIAIFDRIIFPLIPAYINWQIRNYIQTGLVSLILILGGVKLILGNKVGMNADKEKEGDSSSCEDGE